MIMMLRKTIISILSFAFLLLFPLIAAAHPQDSNVLYELHIDAPSSPLLHYTDWSIFEGKRSWLNVNRHAASNAVTYQISSDFSGSYSWAVQYIDGGAALWSGSSFSDGNGTTSFKMQKVNSGGMVRRVIRPFPRRR